MRGVIARSYRAHRIPEGPRRVGEINLAAIPTARFSPSRSWLSGLNVGPESRPITSETSLRTRVPKWSRWRDGNVGNGESRVRDSGLFLGNDHAARVPPGGSLLLITRRIAGSVSCRNSGKLGFSLAFPPPRPLSPDKVVNNYRGCPVRETKLCAPLGALFLLCSVTRRDATPLPVRIYNPLGGRLAALAPSAIGTLGTSRSFQ